MKFPCGNRVVKRRRGSVGHGYGISKAVWCVEWMKKLRYYSTRWSSMNRRWRSSSMTGQTHTQTYVCYRFSIFLQVMLQMKDTPLAFRVIPASSSSPTVIAMLSERYAYTAILNSSPVIWLFGFLWDCICALLLILVFPGRDKSLPLSWLSFATSVVTLRYLAYTCDWTSRMAFRVAQVSLRLVRSSQLVRSIEEAHCRDYISDF